MITSSVRFAKIAGPAASCACPVMEGGFQYHQGGFQYHIENIYKMKLNFVTNGTY